MEYLQERLTEVEINQINLEMQIEYVFRKSQELKPLIYIAIGIGAVAIIIGLINLWNQRKIKKQLRQLLESQQEKETEESE